MIDLQVVIISIPSWKLLGSNLVFTHLKKNYLFLIEG